MLFPVRNLGSAGVATPDDAPSADLPPHAFTDANSAVFRDHTVRKTQGYETVISPLPEDAYWFQSWFTRDGSDDVLSIAFGMEDTIYTSTDTQYVTQAALYDQAGAVLGTPPGTMTTPRTLWQSEVFGQFCIMNNGADIPMYSTVYTAGTPSSWRFDQIPGWGKGLAPSGAVSVIRSAYNHLVALGVENSPFTVFTSVQGSPEMFPGTDPDPLTPPPDEAWDNSIPGTTARSIPLQSRDGPIIDGGMLGGRFIVYQSFACSAMDYVGGDLIVGITRLFENGLINRDAWCQFENLHLVVGEREIYIHDGSSVKRPDDNTVRHRFFGEVVAKATVRCAHDPENHEVIIYYNGNRALIYSYLENTWTFEDIGQNVQRLAQSPQPGDPITWAELTMPWSDINFSWASMNSIDRTTKLMQLHTQALNIRNKGFKRVGTVEGSGFEFGLTEATGTDRFLAEGTAGSGDRLIFDFGEEGSGPVDYDAWAERAYLDLDELTQDAAKIKRVMCIYPQIRGQGRFDLQFGISTTTHDPVRWTEKKLFDFDATPRRERIDVRLAGRYLHWRIGSWDGTNHPGWWAMSGMDIDINLEGRR